MEKETLEEATERYIAEDNKNRYYYDFIAGAKWQQERSYSEQEVYEILLDYQSNYPYANNEIGLKKWFENFKKK